VDGTCGGALRFVNHCLESEEPNATALVVNHFGVPYVCFYCCKAIAEGEEITIRYTDVSDADFFASSCGLD